ncbi:flavin reductase family protein [Aestuariivirga sp.]|uniref:flavin reductase family protein n=1 Tax=Aestuariivirga sp. TaxID=2650926 RepID=UPI003BA9C7D0
MNDYPAKPAVPPLVTGLKGAMRFLTGGVSVITAGIGEDVTGLTVTTAHSLSMDPPVMIISVNRNSSGYAAISKHRHFCVNILSAEQRDVAERFSGFGGIKGRERYQGSTWSALATGALALDGALASVDCEVTDVINRYSHGLFLGEVRQVRLADASAAQLVYRNGAYGIHP